MRSQLSFCVSGLSPRVRGNLVSPLPQLLFVGSIPACAGEPIVLAVFQAEATVYPRVCGGTASTTMTAVPIAGLSPRVRGNLL